MELKIGDKVWIFDENTRKYTDEHGNKTVGTWYRGHFVEKHIIGETKVSWIIGYQGSTPDNRDIKVNKKTLLYNRQIALDGQLYVSEEDINQHCWIHDNKHLLSRRVQDCKDYQKLKEIEEILNRK